MNLLFLSIFGSLKVRINTSLFPKSLKKRIRVGNRTCHYFILKVKSFSYLFITFDKTPPIICHGSAALPVFCLEHY